MIRKVVCYGNPEVIKSLKRRGFVLNGTSEIDGRTIYIFRKSRLGAFRFWLDTIFHLWSSYFSTDHKPSGFSEQ